MVGGVRVTQGDCREVLAARDGDAELYDSAATDPPYHLSSIVERFGKKGSAPAKVGATGAFARASRGFMEETWDGGDVAFQPETWRAVWESLKPGAHLVAFGHSRNFHRIVCAIEDAGFIIRDTLYWIYGTGFPKNHDMSKAIDAHLGVERPIIGTERISNDMRGGGLLDVVNGDKAAFVRNITASGSDEAREWEGWGTALKPAFEPIVLAQKPISERSIAANVLKWGVGALNIDACRIEADGDEEGRWPANILTDGSAEVFAQFPNSDGQQSGVTGLEPSAKANDIFHKFNGRNPFEPRFDSGSAARFFYSAKAGNLDRLGSQHATIKPVELMRWLIRLITPPGGRILDPFAGSGTTGIAAMAEGRPCDLIELLPKHVEDIERRLAILTGAGRHLLVEINANKKRKPSEPLPLFGDDEGTAAA